LGCSGPASLWFILDIISTVHYSLKIPDLAKGLGQSKEQLRGVRDGEPSSAPSYPMGDSGALPGKKHANHKWYDLFTKRTESPPTKFRKPDVVIST
jgi:hypothetical protein